VVKDLQGDFKKMHIAAAGYSPDGKFLAIARGGECDGTNGKVWLLDPATGKKLKEFTPGHQYGATDLCFHPDGKHLISAGRDTVMRIWSLPDGKMIKELNKPRGGQFKDWIHAVAVTPDGRCIAAADMVGAVQVWMLG
jgi:WD40 repeat protein